MIMNKNVCSLCWKINLEKRKVKILTYLGIDEHADVVAATHVMAVLLGALDDGREWKIVRNIDLDAVTVDEAAFVQQFEKLPLTGSLLCATGAINHYAINHTNGQACLQGFALKVCCGMG